MQKSFSVTNEPTSLVRDVVVDRTAAPSTCPTHVRDHGVRVASAIPAAL